MLVETLNPRPEYWWNKIQQREYSVPQNVDTGFKPVVESSERIESVRAEINNLYQVETGLKPVSMLDGPKKREVEDRPQYSAEFTKPVADSLRRGGVKVEYVNPVPVNQGAHHMIYSYNEPDKPEKVIKLKKDHIFEKMASGAEGVEKNFETLKNNFPAKYIINTEVIKDPNNKKFYAVVQDRVKGEVLSRAHMSNPEIREQVNDFAKYHREFYRKEKGTFDFVGGPGYKVWRKKQFNKFLLKKSDVIVSNLMVDSEGQLKIVDYECRDHASKKLKERVIAKFSFLANRIFMKHYFGVDIKKG